MLMTTGLSVEVAGRAVLEDADLALHSGDKVGLVGRNGAGKTSLLKVLAGEETPSSGRVLHRGELGYLRQDPRLHESSTADTALAQIISGRDLFEAARRLEKLRLALEETQSKRNVERFARAEDSYRLAGGYSAEAEAKQIASGLGLGLDRLDLPVAVLSGGERRRVELARILFAGSDVLLLDEPTNHLDNDAKRWLMKWLGLYKGALLVVSHDLVLLDASITKILHLDDLELTEYRGTYSSYREARKKDEVRRGRTAARQQSEIKRLSSLADAMRGQTAKRARTAKSIDTRVARLRAGALSAPKGERSIRVRFPDPPRAGKVVLEVTDLAKSYGGPPVFSELSFDVGRDERLLVMGLNGAGKTSLLRILAGESEPDSGRVELGPGASLGYYAQEHEGITPGEDVLSHMRSQSGAPDQVLRSLIGMFGLSGEFAWQDAGTLSGGEKTKLALAQLVAGRHNLLLLDEPTNNLDPPSLEAVAAALGSWPGAMVIVSHDPEFVRRLEPERILMMPEGDLDLWSDDLLGLVSLA